MCNSVTSILATQINVLSSLFSSYLPVPYPVFLTIANISSSREKVVKFVFLKYIFTMYYHLSKVWQV